MPFQTEDSTGVKPPARVDLRILFPQTLRLVALKSRYAIGMMTLIVVVYVMSAISFPPESGQASQAIDIPMRLLFYAGMTAAAAHVIYELLLFLSYGYGIEREHLTIIYGLFFRTRASFPIGKINDVSLHRTPIEMLFGVTTLTILTASPTGQYGSIEGLPPSTAQGLQAYLLALVETTLPDVDDRKASTLLGGRPDRIDRSV